MDEARRVVVRERRERDRRRVRLPSAPARTAREELGPRGADDEHRHSGRPVDQVVDEVEQAVVRPVQILEDENRAGSARRALRRTVARRRTPPTCRSPPPCSSAARPTSGRRWPSTHWRSEVPSSASATTSESFSSTCSALSVSRMPAWALIISLSAQYVTPSPYGRQRPCRQYMISGSPIESGEELGDEPALADARARRRASPAGSTPPAAPAAGRRAGARSRARVRREALPRSGATSSP